MSLDQKVHSRRVKGKTKYYVERNGEKEKQED